MKGKLFWKSEGRLRPVAVTKVTVERVRYLIDGM
jgi:hypothetical protein